MQTDGSFTINTNTGTTVQTKKEISNDAGVSEASWKYILSFGGQNMNAPQLTDGDIDHYVSGFVDNYHKVKREYGFDGFDVDVENGLNANYIKAMRKVLKQLGREEFITMAPQPPNIDPSVPSCIENPWNSYVPLVSTDVIDYVALVMPQLYNNNMPFGELTTYVDRLTDGEFEIDCPWAADGTTDGKFTVKIPKEKFAAGFPAVMPGAAGSVPSAWEKSPEGIKTYYKENPSLRQTGGIMTWSIGWDASNSWKFIDNVKDVF